MLATNIISIHLKNTNIAVVGKNKKGQKVAIASLSASTTETWSESETSITNRT